MEDFYYGETAKKEKGDCAAESYLPAAGMNESKYVRELILHGGVDATHAEDRRNLIRQISGIATNINQMAKRCNENKRIDNSDVFRLMFELGDIKKLLQQLMERWW